MARLRRATALVLGHQMRIIKELGEQSWEAIPLIPTPVPIMGLILAVTDRETRTSRTAFQLFRKQKKALQFLDKYGIIVSIICRVL